MTLLFRYPCFLIPEQTSRPKRLSLSSHAHVLLLTSRNKPDRSGDHYCLGSLSPEKLQ